MSGQQLKRLRLTHHYTQKELAQKLGVSRQALCMWESEKREIKVGFLKKIAKTFCVSVDDIISSNKILFSKKEKVQMKAKPKAKATLAPKAKVAKPAVAVAKPAVAVAKSAVVAEKTKTTKASAPKTAPKALKKAKKVQIKLSAPDAKNVFLLGDFNSWDSTGIRMQKNNRGVWETDISLEPGRYEYKFIVDNEWWTDPSHQNVVWNSVGSQNSVFELN